MRSAPSSIASTIGVLLATPPSISSRPSRSTAGKDTWNRRAGDHGLKRVPVREEKLAAAEQVSRDDVKRDGRLLEHPELEVLGNDLSQPVVGDQVVAGAENAEEAGQWVAREDVPAACSAPHGRKPVRRGGGRRRVAMNAPFSAPTEVPTIRLGATPRS